MFSRLQALRSAAALLAAGVVLTAVGSTGLSAQASDDATLLRLFLKDGAVLVSYGEPARVGNRVVFSMPAGPLPNPPLQLVNIAADRVDWERTDRYTASARQARYLQTQAEIDYAALSNRITETLNQVTTSAEPAKRLALVEAARKTLADWPASHFNYRRTEVQQMLSLLDEAIADLRAANGDSRFSLNLLAFADPPAIVEPLLPPPTAKDAIEQVLSAARVVDTATERETLLGSALVALNSAAPTLPATWVTATRAATQAQLLDEKRIDRSYQALTRGIMALATQQARMADVRGLERLTTRIALRDQALGGKRPEAVGSLVTAVQAQLDAARRLRLARDRWALRAPALAQYRVAMSAPLARFVAMKASLERIKSLAGSSPDALAAIERSVERILLQSEAVNPPDELRAAHALLISAAQLARNAVAIRREAVLADNIARAWDASSAAAGALMLSAQARSDIQAALRPPELR